MKIKDGFVLEEVGGSYIAVAVGERASTFSGLVRMNGTGAFLWNFMKDKDVSEEELLAAVLEAYEGVTSEMVEKDISAFVAKLRDGGILE